MHILQLHDRHSSRQDQPRVYWSRVQARIDSGDNNCRDRQAGPLVRTLVTGRGMKITTAKNLLQRLRKDRRAISPAISTAIITSAVVVMLLVTVVFANNYLQQRIAENEFDAAKQFMQTTGLQLDDVSWTIGRTQTIRYASNYGQVNFEAPALNYTVFIDDNPIASYTTGVLFFNMPTNKYNLGNDYYQRVFPANTSFLQTGTSAPVSSVFVIEVVPMIDGNYIRIVVAPSIRMLNSTITSGNTTTNYFNFYLPLLQPGNSPRLSQSMTLQGTDSQRDYERSFQYY